MRERPAQILGLSLLSLLFALAAAGCSASIEERDPALPEGFEGAFLPDVDIRGYLYLSQREPLLATSDKLVDGFVPGPDFPKKVKLSKMVIWASASPRVYGMLYEFSDTHVARSLAEELESSTMEFRHRRQGNKVYLFRGSGDWIEALKASIAEGRFVTGEAAYPDTWVLYNLLPEASPGEPLAAGFGILDSEFMDRLARDVVAELRVFQSFVRSARLRHLVFGLYSTQPLTDFQELGRDTLLGNPHQGAVVATRSSYPGFLVSFIFGSTASRARFEKVTFSDSQGKEKVFYTSPNENFHAMIKNRGDLFTVALSVERKRTEELMLRALGR